MTERTEQIRRLQWERAHPAARVALPEILSAASLMENARKAALFPGV